MTYAVVGSAQRAALASIELRRDLDIARYGDLLQLAADLDRPPPTLSVVDTLLPDILAETSKLTLPPPSWVDRVRTWLTKQLGAHDGVAPQWLQDGLTRFAAHGELLSLLQAPHPTLHAPFAALLDTLEPHLYERGVQARVQRGGVELVRRLAETRQQRARQCPPPLVLQFLPA